MSCYYEHNHLFTELLLYCFCLGCRSCSSVFFFFFNDTATTEIYTLSLHDALPISSEDFFFLGRCCKGKLPRPTSLGSDRKSTRLNSSHLGISYAVFCLKKKNRTLICKGSRRSPR